MLKAGRGWLHDRGRQAWLALLVVGIVVAAGCYYADRLTHYCRLAPYNWFNFFDFWQKK